MTDFMGMTSGSDLGVFALGLVIAGVVGGLIAGMLGVGGGIVIVPVLYHVLAGLGFGESLRMHLAVGTSLATIIPTSISSLRAHSRRGNVDWALLKRWVVPMIVGVAIGTGEARTVALAGLASAITQSLSMGAVVYTSTKAERDLYFHAVARERRQVAEEPDEAREDVRRAYAQQGFEGALRDEIVERLTSDEERWASTMVTAELGLAANPPLSVAASEASHGYFRVASRVARVRFSPAPGIFASILVSRRRLCAFPSKPPQPDAI